MDRLTVAHDYDPATGFIVARETVSLPLVLAESPPLSKAVAEGERLGLPVVAFATADRCAPCQQYKRDALNDPGVIARLSSGRYVATHIEVDRHPGEADALLGSRAIPMTYLIESGRITAELRGQRSARELQEWLDKHAKTYRVE